MSKDILADALDLESEVLYLREHTARLEAEITRFRELERACNDLVENISLGPEPIYVIGTKRADGWEEDISSPLITRIGRLLYGQND